MKLAISPSSTEGFVADLGRLQVTLPLRPSETDLGVVIDADGRDVFTVDSNGDRPDEEACTIALLIVMAVNTCGGFRVEVG